ncbi:hypothetical protein FSOLCH5_014669 [Fusarium solani]
MDSWEEIFTDDPPAGRLITAANDETVWVAHDPRGTAEGDDEDIVMTDDDDEEVEEDEDDEDDEEGDDEVNDLPQILIVAGYDVFDVYGRVNSFFIAATAATAQRYIRVSDAFLSGNEEEEAEK